MSLHKQGITHNSSPKYESAQARNYQSMSLHKQEITHNSSPKYESAQASNQP